MARSRSADRTRAVEDLAADLAVTAGAGAGKTTVLVDRFVNIARTPGLGPDRILAITFTRKAAAEMKERVIRVFEGKGDTARRRLTEAAYISTIHGFSERILRENPFAARIDPAFGVLTAYDEALFVEESLASMYQREDLRAFARRLGQEYGGGWRVFSLVREVARLMREGSESARSEAGAIHDEDLCVKTAVERAESAIEGCEALVLEALTAVGELFDPSSQKKGSKTLGNVIAYVAAAADCLAKNTLRGADLGVFTQRDFTQYLPIDVRARAKATFTTVRDGAKRVLGFDRAEQEALERELLPLKRAVYAAAKEIDEAYQKHKAQSGKLDFHDLQLRARDLLRDVPDVRDAYVERFRHILLDESQDTDDLQHELVSLLRRDDNVLFMVGDPKQAIFEFRGANPDVFHRELNRLAKRDQLALPENFRSREEIVVFVNGLGMQLLPDQFATIDAQADYGETTLEGPAITSILAVQQPNADGSRGAEPAAEVRPREAAAVAEEIVQLLKTGTKVRDPHSREPKWIPLQPRHIAMLFRTRTAIPYFERALAERGLPYVTASGQGFYERAEVLDCMMALRAIEQPLDDMAIAAVLRSPMVGASDEQLWELRQLAGEQRPLYPQLKKHPSLAAFGIKWSALRRAMRGRPASEVLDAVFAETGYLAAIAAAAEGPVMLGNVAKVRRRLRDMGAVTAGTAYAELVRARTLMDKEPLAAVFGEADNVVVLTTIHNAKGLEWPIVCLPNLSGAPRGDKPLFSARHGVLLLKALTDDGAEKHPESLTDIFEEIEDRAEQEERRLFYVALTRARERLILSATIPDSALRTAIEKARDEKENAPERFASPLHFLIANTDETLVVEREGGHDCESFRTDVRHMRGPVEARTIWEGGEPLSRSVKPTVVESVPDDPPPIVALPLGVKVTELLTYRRCPQVYRFAHVLEIEENVARRAVVRGATKAQVSSVELGTIVHGLLERADFRAADLKAEAQRLVAGEDEALRPRLEKMLLAVLDGEIGAMVRAAKRVEREWPFAKMLDGVLVEGVIDLAVQGADGAWTVIDYKSNDISRSGRLEYLADYYAPQLELYALALAGAGLGEVRECMLVFLQGPRVHPWAFRAADCLTESWARKTIGLIGRGEYGTEPGPKCEMCGYRKRKVCTIGRRWNAQSPLGTHAQATGEAKQA